MSGLFPKSGHAQDQHLATSSSASSIHVLESAFSRPVPAERAENRQSAFDCSGWKSDLARVS